jgi:hypothetical protein
LLAAAVAALVLAATGAANAGNPRSQVRLLGTVVSSDATRSLAMVEAGGASRAVRVGEDLDGATVVEIRSESVVLRRRGEREILALALVSRPASSRGSDVPASPAASDAELAATDHTRADAAARRAARPGRARPRRRRVPIARAPAPPRNTTGCSPTSRSRRFGPVSDDNGKLRQWR